MKREALIRKIENGLLKLKKSIDYVAIVGFFYILLYRIDALRSICKSVCIYIVEWFLPIELEIIKEFYLLIEGVFRVVILTSVFCSIVSVLIRLIRDRIMQKKTGENRFEKSLFRYLRENTVARCFLVTGQWGVGKTYEVNQFFDKYYRHTKARVYRVSCFGLNSRQYLIDEINNTIEQGDQSFYAQIIKVLQLLPVIGEALNKVLKKTYGYDSIEKGSVFIFDDFERITSRPITSEYSGELYHQSHSRLRNVSRGGTQAAEFDEINKEFTKVAHSFSELENFANKNSLREDYDKYIAVIGFINELIEVYGMKVIIVCNSDILGEKFVHDILKSKLNCLEYRKVITPEVRLSVIDEILNQRVFEDEMKQKIIMSYLCLVKGNIQNVEFDDKFKDMRLFSGLLEAFISTAVLFNVDMLTNDFLSSLLNSIMIMHLAHYNNSIDSIASYVNGANIDFLIYTFGGPLNDTANLFCLNHDYKEMKWVDKMVSGYWILNLTIPDHTRQIYEEWENYQYSELEDKIIKKPELLLSENKYDLMHLLFYLVKSDNRGFKEKVWQPYVEQSLVYYDLSNREVVQNILTLMYQICNGRIYENFQNALFDVLAKGEAEGELVIETYIDREYSEFIGKKESNKIVE